jgi:hypothetical protein
MIHYYVAARYHRALNHFLMISSTQFQTFSLAGYGGGLKRYALKDNLCIFCHFEQRFVNHCGKSGWCSLVIDG